MAFNRQVSRSYAGGVQTAFIAPWASYTGSKIALSTIVAGSITSTAGLVLTPANTFQNLEWGSLSANVQTGLTTSGITAQTIWQVSNDGTNWATVAPAFGGAYTTVAAAGTGGLVTTTYVQSFIGVNLAHPWIRLAVLSAVQTGAAGDNVTVSYNFRQRWTVS
jgi:hypothetical protein